MARRTLRRMPRLESLESREVLSGPSADAQYMLELINLARTNPSGAADRITQNLDADTKSTLAFYGVDVQAAKAAIAASTPQQPVAWNAQLTNAAQSHSQDMADHNFESHSGSDGSTPDTRMQAAGYTNRVNGAEVAYTNASSVDNAMQAFLLDWGNPDLGHRKSILQPGTSSSNAFTDAGIGLVDASKLGIGPKVVTVDFGRQANSKPQLLGVVYNDNNHDNFYEPGEGRGNVEIDATNLTTGQTSVTQSMDAGGYQMPLTAGTYAVQAKVNGQVVQSQQVTIGNQNVKTDFILNNAVPSASTARAFAPVALVTPPAPTPPPAPVTPPPPPAPAVVASVVVTPPVATTPVKTATPVQTAATAAQNSASNMDFDINWVVSWTSWKASSSAGA